MAFSDDEDDDEHKSNGLTDEVTASGAEQEGGRGRKRGRGGSGRQCLIVRKELGVKHFTDYQAT